MNAKCPRCDNELIALVVNPYQIEVSCPIHGEWEILRLHAPRCCNCGKPYEPVVQKEIVGEQLY